MGNTFSPGNGAWTLRGALKLFVVLPLGAATVAFCANMMADQSRVASAVAEAKASKTDLVCVNGTMVYDDDDGIFAPFFGTARFHRIEWRTRQALDLEADKAKADLAEAAARR
jgi:hypothetical protein